MAICYTEEEIQKLYDALRWKRLALANGLSLIDVARIRTAAGSSDGKPPWDSHQRFTKLELLDILTKRKYNKPTPLEFFVQEVPFEEVPLYLDTYPELAKWRLNIAK